MSTCYWGICGYGIENIQNLVSEEKIKAHNPSLDYEMDLTEYGSEYYHSKNFYFISDGVDSTFFLYSPNLPFERNEEEKAFTSKDDIATAMYESIKDILLDDVTLESFKEKMEWVSTYGAG